MPSPRHRELPAGLAAAARREKARRNIVWWAEKHFYIEDTERPIILAPHQKAILRHCLTRKPNGRLPYDTIIYSAPKKSGKTAIAGVVTRWAAETWGRFGEVMCVGNDANQARERAFAALAQSIILTPGYVPGRQELPRLWRILTKEALCLSTGTKVKAVATDYRGEAGGNPILTVWTELWGFTQKDDLRFWAEMAPSPTRPDSIRWIETYAGFEGESELLYGLYSSAVIQGRRLTAGEMNAIGSFEEAPKGGDAVPCYVNERARIFAYWDDGLLARRMPWQRGERGAQYYASEEATQTPAQMARLHNNEWVSAESEFVPIEWWDACANPLPLVPGDKTPMIMALDAAVSGDCFGLVVVSRDPANPRQGITVRAARKWEPPAGGKIDYRGPEEAVRWFCKNFNVVEVAYDEYQLHDFAKRLQAEGLAWFRVFGQGQERTIADKGLYDLIVQRRIRHDGNQGLRSHITNANAKQSSSEDTKLRMVKKAESRKIDLAVCLSMAAAECLRLNI